MEVTIGQLAAGEDLSQAEMASAMDAIMRGECSPQQIALFLTGLALKGETAEELAGAASALRRHMTPIRSSRSGILDTCGTGGDGSGTFNISTAAALVTAAAGVPTAKHGNRRATSRSGSADVLAALGVNVEIGVPRVEQCLEELGICFCFAPLLHPAMRHVSDVRKQLGVPTIFNLLGPLANPAGAAYQLIGVGHQQRRRQIAQALALLGTTRSLVVTGEDGLDEVTLRGATHVTDVGQTMREFAWSPEDFGIRQQPLDSLSVSGPQQSAAMIREVLSGAGGPARDIVVLNAAAALYVVGKSDNPAEAAALAAETIDRGAAWDLLAALVRFTNG
jgi:anthranilate phosphoribosyltransferase